jgi:predicted metal-dependent hydrolase
VLPREYVSGESHFYLGRRHVLKIHLSKAASSGVRMLRGRLDVTAATRDAKTVKGLLDAWYRKRAHEVFKRRLALCAERADWLKALPALRLLKMKTQWGSCSPRGEIIVNPALVKAPSACIDYVLSHELCHIQEHNHGDRFYHLLERLMPDWKDRKRELDDMAELILNR